MSRGIEQVGVDRCAHVVQFYGGEGELTDGVGSYLGDGIEAGEAVVVVATDEHRRAFEAWLGARGIDVGTARARRDFIALDAAETLRHFMTGDRPDPDGFEAAIGGVIREAAAAPGRPVRVYGEMVALLWDVGHVNAAIELEGLWNALAQRLPFLLWCGYPARLFSGADQAVEEICGVHSAVIGRPAADAEQATRSFANAHDAPRTARHFVTDTVRPWGDTEFVQDATIVASELAANAVVHARSDFTVVVSRSAATVRISVQDNGLALPAEEDSPLVAAPGHGLGLVAALATQWAVEPLPGGKVVWAELRGSSPAR